MLEEMKCLAADAVTLEVWMAERVGFEPDRTL
jgi:hypothetical protein